MSSNRFDATAARRVGTLAARLPDGQQPHHGAELAEDEEAHHRDAEQAARCDRHVGHDLLAAVVSHLQVR